MQSPLIQPLSRPLVRPLFQSRSRGLPWLVASVLCVVAVQAQAQWAWRDKNGQVNASDRPPPRDIPDKDVLSRPTPDASRRAAPATTATAAPAAVATAAPAVPASGALPTTTASKSPLDRELEARKRAADQEQAAKAKADEERLTTQRADNCRRARTQLAALESGQRIARINDKGEREVLDDRARAAEVRQARDVTVNDCR